MQRELTLVLGVTRATEFMLQDDLIRRPRAYLIRRSNERTKATLEAATETERRHWAKHPDEAPFAYVAKLLTCPWCMSVWVAAAALTGLKRAPRLTERILSILSLSLVAVVLDHLVDRLEDAPDDEPTTSEPVPAHVAAAFEADR